MIRIVAIVFVFVLGISLGLWLRQWSAVPSPVPAVTPSPLAPVQQREESLEMLIDAGKDQEVLARLNAYPSLRREVSMLPSEQRRALGNFYETSGAKPAWLLFADARSELRQTNSEAAFDALSEAALVLDSRQDEAEMRVILRELVAQLVASGDEMRLDALLTDITLAMPERPEFFLQLATLRMDSGRTFEALQVLAQIENHGELGAEARRLIAVIEGAQSESLSAAVPLRQNGNQFLVAAILDEGQPVELLIDTGAALTIVDAGLLARMGYDLGAAPTARFATAGGTVVAPVLTIESIQIGEQTLGPLRVGALSINLPDSAQGLLGMNVLGQYEFFIDQDRRELHLVR